MPRYINAEKIEWHTLYFNGGKQEITYKDEIDALPTEDVAPIVHSNWRAENNPSYSPFDYTMDSEVYFCNNCNNKQYKMSSYCPCCGAKMDKR